MKNKLNTNYRKKIEQINVDGEEYADDEMIPVYAEQKKSLDALHVFIGLLFIKYAINGFLKPNTMQKANITVEVQEKLKTMGKDLGESEVSKVTDILDKVYEDTYYKNAYTMESGMDVNLKFGMLKQEFIDAAVNAKLDGELFSDRIWENKSDMIDKLQSALIDCMNGNTTIDKIGKDIQNTFNVSAYESKRLVITELTRIQAQAQTDIGVSAGCTKQMWSSALDDKTCDECASLDSQIFDIDDSSRPEMPLHPFDRCCWINIPPSGNWEPSVRKDNESKDIIDYVDYSQWAKDKGIE